MTILRTAVISSEIVVNVIVADEAFELDGFTLVASDTAQIGDLYEDGEFTTSEPAPVTADQVNAERDRRFERGFYYDGVLFQSDPDSRENVVGAGTMALGAMMAGKHPGDIRWARPDRDFTWTAADNSQIPMDAQTTFAFAASLGIRKDEFIKAAQKLKAMDPIPTDYASSDAYWPALEP